MAPHIGGPDNALEQQDHSGFNRYSPDNYSDSEMDNGRGKGANGKPRTRLGYQRISIACCISPLGFRQISNVQYTVAEERFDVFLPWEKATDVRIVLVNTGSASFNPLLARHGKAAVIRLMHFRQIPCLIPKRFR